MRYKKMLGKELRCENKVHFDDVDYCTPCRHILLCQNFLIDSKKKDYLKKLRDINAGVLNPTGREKKKYSPRKMIPVGSSKDACLCGKQGIGWTVGLTFFSNGMILCRECKIKHLGPWRQVRTVCDWELEKVKEIILANK